MGIDPSTPAMTFLLVMLHTGTMVAVLIYFWPRWKKLTLDFFKSVLLATLVTGVVGLTLKAFIEKVILERILGLPNAEIEHLFKSLPLIALALFSVGVLIFIADRKQKKSKLNQLSSAHSLGIGAVQGLCLPFRGFSRSGATISTGLLLGIPRALSEDFSFALAVVLTPPVVAREFLRLFKALESPANSGLDFHQSILAGLLGMIFSMGAGLLALKWLSNWLENGRWKFFGAYCILAAGVVMALQIFWF